MAISARATQPAIAATKKKVPANGKKGRKDSGSFAEDLWGTVSLDPYAYG